LLTFTSVLGQFSLSSPLILERYMFSCCVLVESFTFLGFTKILLTSALKLDAKSQICYKVRESFASPINCTAALFAGEGSWKSFGLLAFLGLASLLADIDLELPVETMGLDALLAILTIFTGSSSSLISSTLTLFLD